MEKIQMDNQLMKFNSFYYFHIKIVLNKVFNFIFKNSFHFLIKCFFKKKI